MIAEKELVYRHIHLDKIHRMTTQLSFHMHRTVSVFEKTELEKNVHRGGVYTLKTAGIEFTVVGLLQPLTPTSSWGIYSSGVFGEGGIFCSAPLRSLVKTLGCDHVLSATMPPY